MLQAFKCVIVGDSGVGKTSLLICYFKSSFPSHVPRMYDVFTKNVMIDDKVFVLNLWDTVGTDDYDRIRPLAYSQADVFLVCFSITDYKSFKNVKEKWCPEISLHCPKVPLVLVGTKQDLRDDRKNLQYLNKNQIISFIQGVEMAKEIKAFSYSGNFQKFEFILNLNNLAIKIYL